MTTLKSQTQEGPTPRETRIAPRSSTQGLTEGSPHVWVGCLACYNAGQLVGDWFDATDAPTDMAAFDNLTRFPGFKCPAAHIGADHWTSVPHEELWVFDHENFYGLLTGECSPMEARELATQLAEVEDVEPFAAFVRNQLSYYLKDLEMARQDFAEAYAGEWVSEAEYAEDLAAEDGDAGLRQANWPYNCIDWEQAARELFMGDYWCERTGRGTVYVFRAV